VVAPPARGPDQDTSAISLPPLDRLAPGRPPRGMGVRHALFPGLALGATGAASFPTPFSAADGVSGLIAGPSSALRLTEFRVRPLSPLKLVVAPPARGPDQDTSAISLPPLDRLAPGRPPLLTVRWPGATGLASYLSGCLSLTSQRSRFSGRRRFGGFSRALP